MEQLNHFNSITHQAHLITHPSSSGLTRGSRHLLWITGLIVAAICSWVSGQYPVTAPYVLAIAAIGYALLLRYDFEAAVLVALLELFVGSFGRWLTVDALSIRYVVFLLLMIVSLVRFYKLWRLQPETIRWAIKKTMPIIVLIVIVTAGIIQGVIRGYGVSTVLADANAYSYLAMILPLWLILQNGDEVKKRIVELLKFSAVVLSVFTLALLFIFTHDTGGLIANMYHWVRDTRLGEITWTTTGAYRIFLQSQLYVLVGFWLWAWECSTNAIRLPVLDTGSRQSLFWIPDPSFAKAAADRQVRKDGRSVFVLCLTAAAILISFSRSFWLGLMIAAVLGGLWLIYEKDWWSVKKLLLYGVIGGVGAFILIVIILNFPIPKPNSQGLFDLRDRLNLTEDAASSRWQLLLPLEQALKRDWLWGAGFGKTVTYISNDPRVRAMNPTGEYTTTAFEWGYFDQWLKFGFLGLAAYAWIIVLIIRGLWQKRKEDEDTWPLFASLVTLLGLHIATPYLNHPLGITFVMLLYTWYALAGASFNRPVLRPQS